MIRDGKSLERDEERSPEVCVIGSGAGGAVVAAGLAARGISVVVLEEGGHYTKADFDLDEASAFDRFYQECGLRSTVDQTISVLQGRTVGGTTTVNWTSSFRTPPKVLAHWRARFGTEVDEAILAPHFDAVEARLGIEAWPVERQNANNQVLWRGAEKLGWHKGQIRRNVRNCMDTGYCGFGCPVDAKQAMHLTFLADAVGAGVEVFADTRADRVELANGKASAVHATVLVRETGRPSGRRVTIRPKLVVAAGGAINTPMLLHRSGLNPNGRVGARTFLHPATGISAEYEAPIRGFYGAPQSVYSHEFAERTEGLPFFLEVAPVHPMLTAAALGGHGPGHQYMMSRLAHTSMIGMLLIDGFRDDEPGGTVGVRDDGRPAIEYPLGPLHMEGFKAGVKAAAKVHLAAGAKVVRTLHREPVVIESEADLEAIDRAPFEAQRFPIFTFHQMGGCTMGADPATTVVSPRLRHHAVGNLFVVDGSVLPTALGVNPSETIYGLAHWAVDHVAAAL